MGMGMECASAVQCVLVLYSRPDPAFVFCAEGWVVRQSVAISVA